MGVKAVNHDIPAEKTGPIILTPEERETAIVRCFFAKAIYIMDRAALRDVREKYPELFKA